MDFGTRSIVMDEKKAVLVEALAQVQQAAGSHTAVPHLTGLLNVQRFSYLFERPELD